MAASREIPTGASQQFEPGDVLGGYLIERLIGVGGMANVYLARHNKLDKQVAIKVLQPHAQQRADLRSRFLREGQAASRIRNPHVVEVFDVGTDGDVPYLVMQYLPGPTLEEHLAERGAMDITEAVHIFLPICAAVAAGHEEGVIHRDLKPENVILAIEGHRTRPTVLDFGVSRLITSDPRLTLDSSVVGTPHYMSPEQARGEAIDSKTDQYAVGVMLYQSVTGRLPRDRASVLELLNEVGHKGFEPPSDHRASIPRDFEAVILKAMAPSRRDRFVTMYELAAALLPFASANAQGFWEEELGIKPVHVDSAQIHSPRHDPETPTLAIKPDVPKPVTLPAPSPREEPARASGKGGWIAAALLLLLVGGAAAAYFLWPTGSESYVVRLRAEPANATIEVDGQVVGQNATLSFEADGTTHQLLVSAPNFETHTASFRDVPPPEAVILRPLATPSSETVTADVEPVADEVEAPVEPSADPSADPPEDTRGEAVGTAEQEPDATPTRRRGGRQGSEARNRSAAPSPSDGPADPPSSTPEPTERPPSQEWRRPDLTENLDPWND